MSRIVLPPVEQLPEASQPILDQVRKNLGFVPNVHRLMAISPAVLQGWFGLTGALNKALDVKTLEGMALAVLAANGCQYCLAAHAHVARNFARLAEGEIALNRDGYSAYSQRGAAIYFAKRLIETRGKVEAYELHAVRAAGYSDSQVVEMVALTAQFLLTNFMNNFNDTDIDVSLADKS